MWFNYLVLLTALTISGVAAYYSIIGLTAIFAAAFWPIVIMGSVLEAGKLVTSVWLKKYWDQANWQLKTYLTSAVVILMLVTSMGIFGFLSKAHMDQGVPTGDITAQVNLFDEKIKTQRDNIESNRKALAQMDATVDQTIGRSTTEQGAANAANLRRSQQRERGALQNEIAVAQKAIAKLNEERAPIASQLRKVEAEVGPIKYIAALVYGDNPDQNLLEKAVRWVIIILVLVFDPLAIALILAANSSMRWVNEKPKPDDSPLTETPPTIPELDSDVGKKPTAEELKEPAPPVNIIDPPDLVAQANQAIAELEPPAADIDEVIKDAELDLRQQQHQQQLEQSLTTLEKRLADITQTSAELADRERELTLLNATLVGTVDGKDQIIVELATKLDDTMQVSETNQHRLNNQIMASENGYNRAITEKQDQIKQLQQQITEQQAQIVNLEQALVEIAETPVVVPPVVTMEPEIIQTTDLGLLSNPASAGFGDRFPTEPQKGDMFVRTDFLPSKVFKFNGNKWIEVDKNNTDTYVFNDEYVRHLVEQLSKGEIEIDQLSDIEKEEVKRILKKDVVLGK
jgi:hypothetical protein